MRKQFLYLLLLFIFGMAGGIFADQIFWPYFIERPLFYEYKLEKPPIFLTERKEVIIRENQALEEAVERVSRTVVGVRTKLKTSEIVEGSGLIVTNDGLIVTLASLAPAGENFSFFAEGKPRSFQVLKRDFQTNLALIKLEAGGLATVGFADKLKLGETIFLVGSYFDSQGQVKKAVSQGIIRSIEDGRIATDIFEKSIFQGSPVFNVEGEVIGLADITADSQVLIIPSAKIKSLLGL